MRILKIKTKSKHYNIYIGHNIIKKLTKIFKKENLNFQKSLIVFDKNVPNKFIKKLKTNIKSKKKFYLFIKCNRKK